MSKHALIIDPNRDRFAVYRDLLREERIDVEWAQNGLRACDYLRTHDDVGLVVAELSLPGADGFQVLKCLKTTANAGIPVLIVSAFRDMRKSAVALRAELGISCVLTTSTPREALRRVLQRLLRDEPVESGAHSAHSSSVDEERRLDSMERAGALRSDPLADAELRKIVERVAREMNAPVALVSLVVAKKQWFKARIGTGVEQTSLDVSFCRHVVEAKAPMIVPDATLHPTFADNGLVHEKFVRGYAGAPLIGSDGEVWGSLCVIDPDKPLRLSSADLDRLCEVAKVVVAEIEAGASRTLSGGIAVRYGTFEERAKAILGAASSAKASVPPP